jgi:membrane protein YqaA with SNARE-associated domain
MEILQTLFNTPSQPLLFILSFLAATLLPIGSEWLLIVMILEGFNPNHTVLTATLGNYLGACTNYCIGIWGSEFLTRKLLRIDIKEEDRARNIYRKYGSWSLLFAWLPVVGDPLCVLAGAFRVHFLKFSLLVFIGKFLRYAILAFFVLQGKTN